MRKGLGVVDTEEKMKENHLRLFGHRVMKGYCYIGKKDIKLKLGAFKERARKT